MQSSDESDDGASSAAGSAILSPTAASSAKLSKKAKARKRAAERKAASASKSTSDLDLTKLTNGKTQTTTAAAVPSVTVSDASEGVEAAKQVAASATQALQENVVQPVSDLIDTSAATAKDALAPSPAIAEPTTQQDSFASTPYSRSELSVQGSSSDLDDDDGSEGDSASDDDAAEVLASSTAAAPLSESHPVTPLSPQSTRHSRSRSGSRQDGALMNGSANAVGSNTGADHQPSTKWTSAITRTLWTFLMLFGFICASIHSSYSSLNTDNRMKRFYCLATPMSSCLSSSYKRQSTEN